MSRRFVDREPDDLSAEDIAAWLSNHGRERSARFVRRMAARCEDFYLVEERLHQQINHLIKRLHAYEPPAEVREPASYKPDWRSSD